MSGMIPKHVVEEIRLRNDIVDVIGSYVPLKRRGSSIKALCPFHTEKTPSFNVNAERQIFHCFGCGEGGDVFGFMMKQEGVDFVMAARMLAQRANIPLEFEEKKTTDGIGKDELFRLHADVAAFYHRCLLDSPGAEHARAYLVDRQLPEEAWTEWQIGYAPGGWTTILDKAKTKGYSLKALETAGLALKSSSDGPNERYYDRFRNRLMFPIRDEQARVIAFSGRLLDSQAKAAKYVNSPETPLFLKSRVLYGLHKARRPIVDSREAIICEGQIDVIRCHVAGFTTAVAAQGTAFTDTHGRVLKRYADGVNVVFDSDKAGQEAATRAAEVFLNVGLSVRITTMPPDTDPDAFILANGPDAFGELMANASSALDFLIDVLTAREDAESEAGIIRISRAVLESISRSPDAVQRARLLQRAAQRLNLPAHSLEENLRQLTHRRPPARVAEERPVPEEGAPPPAAVRPRQEEELVRHLVTHPELAYLVEYYLPLSCVSDPQCGKLLATVLEANRDQRAVADVVAAIDPPDVDVSSLYSKLAMAPEKVTGNDLSTEDAIKDCILAIHRAKLKSQCEDLERRIQAGDADNVAMLRKERLALKTDIARLRKWHESTESLLEAITSLHATD